jgi:UDP-GlcNAc3NAcA epimerase
MFWSQLQILTLREQKVIFSIHPRTRISFIKYGWSEDQIANINLIDPQPYFENIGYIKYSDALITDSGGMQKEAYLINKKCITIRSETEWVETLTSGANTLMFDDLSSMQTALNNSDIEFDYQLYGSGNSCAEIVDVFSAN